jgi:tetratricopeptide (TPR) repeat protein
MSDLSNRAAEAISKRDLREGGRLAFLAVDADPNDYHAHYVVGLFFRYSDEYDRSCAALEYASRLNPTDKSVLLALAISHQLAERFEISLQAVDRALSVDRDYSLAYNTAGMTLKRQGRYAEASAAYDDGARALARVIIKSMINSADSQRVPHGDTRNSLWTDYAVYGTLVIASIHGEVDGVSYPSGELAELDRRTGEFKGWYWIDQTQADTRVYRFFTPNYFGSFRRRLLEDGTFANLMGNRSTVLRLMGDDEEADKHFQEAEDFSG